MIRTFRLAPWRFISLLAMACCGAASFALSSISFVPDQLVVRVKPYSQIAERAYCMQTGAEVIGVNDDLNIHLVRLPSNVSVNTAIAMWKSLPFVMYAQPNRILQYDFNPNDPMFAQQYAHQKIKTPLAWDITIGSPTVKIAILDSGCDTSHPDLQSQMLPGYDFVNNDPIPEDDVGHGTHVAGCASAATNNALGVAGPGYNCKLVPVKVGDSGGIPTFAIVNGLTWAANQGINVVNMSFGGGFPDQAILNAVNYAWGKKVVLVSSAGNTGETSKHYPAAFDNCIAVGASDQNDQRAGFSTYGNWVDVAAPGVAILSTTVGGGYEAWDGTSMASPVCAGVVGLIWTVTPNATNAEVRATLENNCDVIGNWIIKGRINALKAVQSAPIYDYVPVPATSISPIHGNYLSGNLASITNVDGLFYQVSSIFVKMVGFMSTVGIGYQGPPVSSALKGVTVNVNCQGVNGMTGMLYVWDWNVGDYVWIKSFPVDGNTANTTVAVNLAAPFTKWINGSGQLKVAVRGLTPARMNRPFVFSLDRVQVVRKVLQ